MEAPKPTTQDKIIKRYSLTSDKLKKYQISFGERDNNLYIQAQEEEGFLKHMYEGLFSLEKIKENKFFNIYNSINEIFEELFPLIETNKAELKEEGSTYINLIINLPLKKVKEISFILNQVEKSDKSKINELYQIVSDLQKENSEIKKINQNLINKIKELEKRMDIFEKKFNDPKLIENIKIKEKLNSDIINSKDNFEFVEKIIKENVMNKNIRYTLLYKATRDGDDSKVFHQKCDNNHQIIVFFKTTKGFIFGGYTEKGYTGNGGNIIDNNAFFFSCDKKKVYKVKQNKTAIYDGLSYGPTFGYCTTIICVLNNFLSYKCCTTTVSSSTFDGLNTDYEITNGEEYFYLQEIEVYKILFD